MQWLESSPSTNSALRELVAAQANQLGTNQLGTNEPGTNQPGTNQLPHGTLIATANQTAGRGRQGRDWQTPPNTAVAASLLLRPSDRFAMSGLGLSWLSLLAGSAIARALQPLFQGEDREPMRVGVKWPNDVHVRGEEDAIASRPGAKLCGILCEALPTGEVIVGFGINLLLEDWQLPTERAGSVLVCGGDVGGAKSLADSNGQALADRVLAASTAEILSLVELATNDPCSARNRVLRDSLTVGAEVRVHLPGGEVVDGRAVGLDEHGALIVDRPTTGQLIVSAADVEHLR